MTPAAHTARATVRRASRPRTPRAALAIGAGAAALAAVALANAALARRAERRNTPAGRLMRIGAVRLHVVERGSGAPLLLLHGNGSMIQDFETSGLVAAAARRYRVIAVDRPGFGHSSRPHTSNWNPAEQADLLAETLARMGATPAIVFAHSWGTLVALALAVRHPASVRGLALASGYYFPTTRPDFVLLGAPALPVLGPVLRHTILPWVSRAVWPILMRQIFGPRPTPGKFRGFPMEMAVRPSQLRAAGEESAMLIGAAAAASRRYASLRLPVAVLTGADDRLVDPEAQSARLSRELGAGSLRRAEGHGHMVHQTAPEAALEAIDEVARRAEAA